MTMTTITTEATATTPTATEAATTDHDHDRDQDHNSKNNNNNNNNSSNSSSIDSARRNGKNAGNTINSKDKPNPHASSSGTWQPQILPSNHNQGSLCLCEPWSKDRFCIKPGRSLRRIPDNLNIIPSCRGFICQLPTFPRLRGLLCRLLCRLCQLCWAYCLAVETALAT